MKFPFLPGHPSRFAAIFIAIVALALPWSTARALELVGGNINKTDPGTFSGTFSQPLPWNNVGQVGEASGIYLGDIGNNGEYWVLTADHVAPGSAPATVNFGGMTYSTVAGSWVQLTNSDSTAADMVLFQINVNANPAGLTTLTLQSTTPSTGTSLYYVGFGTGSDNSVQRWGYNSVAAGGLTYSNDGYGNMTSFSTNYDSSSMNPNEAQGILGDSGGAAFIYNSATSTWQLAGMMFATNDTDPPTVTYSADIATYNSEIMTVVPEPRSPWIFLAGAPVLLLAGRKGRRPAK
jgi:hypothetical protein